ncbi:hypothetical protein EBX93_18925, partial [bacterium]|nr:hypothetical protein [bacterium]
GAANPQYSTSNTLKVGSYSVAPSSINVSSGNFSDTINVVGAYEVTPKSVTVSATNVTKVYDGNTAMINPTLAPVGLVSRIINAVNTTDAVTLSGTGVYADKNVTGSANKAFTLTNLALSGADAANYVLTDGTNMTAITTYNGSNGEITPRPLTVNYSGVNKVYDGLTAATVTTTDNRVSGDTLVINRSADFRTKDVGTAKVIDVTGVNLGGSDAINYSVSATGSTTANITQRVLNVVYSGVNKIYDGGLTASVTTTDDRVSGDEIQINWTANFTDKNVAGAKTINVTGVSLSDPDGVTTIDAGNYTVANSGTASANITPRVLNVTYVGDSRIYNGTTAATVTTTDDRV